MSVREGWYDDPSEAGRLRWWDGQAWTSHTRSFPSDERTADRGGEASVTTPALTADDTPHDDASPDDASHDIVVPDDPTPDDPTPDDPPPDDPTPGDPTPDAAAPGETTADQASHEGVTSGDEPHGPPPAEATPDAPASLQATQDEADGGEVADGEVVTQEGIADQVVAGQVVADPVSPDVVRDDAAPAATPPSESPPWTPPPVREEPPSRRATSVVLMVVLVLGVVVAVVATFAGLSVERDAPGDAPPVVVPTDAPETAGIGQRTEGEIAPDGAWEVPLAIEEATPVRIDVRGEPGFDAIVAVQQDGDYLARNDDRGTAGAQRVGGDPLDPLLEVTLEPGTYTVLVTGFGSSAGAFTVEIASQNDPADADGS